MHRIVSQVPYQSSVQPLHQHNYDEQQAQAAGATAPVITVSINRKYTGKVQVSSTWADFNKTFQVEALDIRGIARTIQAGHAIAAAHHSNRHSDNFISAQHIGLDFDHDSIETVLQQPLIADRAGIVHATSSHTPAAPRSRAVFILDQPIRDAITYARYTAALTWAHGIADQKCKDAARLWFGAKGCEMVVRPDKVLPLAVLDVLVEQYEAQRAEQQSIVDFDPTIDATEALQSAISKAGEGRNDAGFWLACRLRDAGKDKAETTEIIRSYQRTVRFQGNHEYTPEEALASLESAYNRRPRGHCLEQVEKDLELFEWFAWFENFGTKQGATHYSLKTIMHVSDTARKAKRTQGLELALREFVGHGVSKTAASNHLKAMCSAGLLLLEKKSDRERGNRYSINVQLLRDLAQQHGSAKIESPTFDVTQSETYQGIGHLAFFIEGARIDSRLWVSEPPAECFGSTAQRLIATLAMSIRHVSQRDKQGQDTQALLVCPSVTHVNITSKSELYRLANVSRRRGEEKLKLLKSIGLITYELGERGAKAPSLVENWYERLVEIEPALTTYGRNTLLAERYDNQRNSYHDNRLRLIRNPERTSISQKTADVASQRNQERHGEKLALRARRAAWARAHGIANVPAIGDTGKPPKKRHHKPTVAVVADEATGKRKFVRRNLIPREGKITTGKNVPTRQERKEYILERLHLGHISEPMFGAKETILQ